MDKNASQNGGNQLFNGDVSDNNNSVAYQASLNSSQHQQQMMNEKDNTKAPADCTDAPSSASGMRLAKIFFNVVSYSFFHVFLIQL